MYGIYPKPNVSTVFTPRNVTSGEFYQEDGDSTVRIEGPAISMSEMENGMRRVVSPQSTGSR